MPLNWFEEEDGLDSAALTVLAQTVDPTDDGSLVWDSFLPRRDVGSTTISSITPYNYRPVADRREWNQRGRKSVVRLPKTSVLEMTPIESGFTIAEYELQKLFERAAGNRGVVQEIIRADIPQRTEDITQEVYRRLEVDAWTAWCLGQVTVKNAQNGQTITVSFGFDAARYTTAGTAWNGAVNAYDEFLLFMQNARAKIGNVSGAMLRQATFNEIQKDAPNPFGNVVPRLTMGELETRIGSELGSAFRFVINERTLDVKTDGGATTTNVKLWSTGRVAAIPAGGVVGYSAFAPVYRAHGLAGEDAARIDLNSVAVFRETENGGRSLTVEAQLNAFPVPDEQRLFVINAGV